jgi:hypothetical protein
MKEVANKIIEENLPGGAGTAGASAPS